MVNNYKFIYFSKVSGDKKRKTPRFTIFERKGDTHIGLVAWYSPWRQYCLTSAPDVVWNRTCLRDVCNFIDDLMEERRMT